MSARYVSFDEMGPVLDWLTGQRPDSVHAHFSMFRVGFENPQALGNQFGASDAMRRLNLFGNMLAATFRRTDMVTRDLTDFWILTPECNADIVGCRLCEVAGGVKDFGLDVVDCTVGAYLFPLEGVDFLGLGGRKVINRLKDIPAHFKFDPAHDCAVSWMIRTGGKMDDWKGKAQANCYRARIAVPAANP